MVVDKTADLKVVRKLDDDDCCSYRQEVRAVLGRDGEVVERVISACRGYFLAIVQLLNDQVVLRDALDELISKEDIFLIIKMHLDVNYLLLPSLHPLLHQTPTPQLRCVQLKGKRHHAAFPTLQCQVLREPAFLELDEDVIADTDVVPCEDRGKILLVLMRDGEIGLLYAVVVLDLDRTDPHVQELNHSSYILLSQNIIRPSYKRFKGREIDQEVME